MSKQKNETQTTELATLADVAGLPALPMQSDELLGGGVTSPYAFFVHPRAEKYADLCMKLGGKLSEGSQILMLPSGPVKLDPMRFILIDQYKAQYWAVIDSANKVLEASETEVRGAGWKEHIDCVALVFYDRDKITAARITFRGPKCPGVKQLAEEIKRAAHPDWAKQSKAHEMAASIKLPFARVVGSIALSDPIAPRNTSNGQTSYTIANARCEPINAGQFDTLRTAWPTEEFRDVLKKCADDLTKRLNEVKAKVR